MALILPAVLAGTVMLRVWAEGHQIGRTGNWLFIAGWLAAGLGLTLAASESQRWPLAGYLQNFVALLGVCALPFGVACAVVTWLEARGSSASSQLLGITLVLAFLAILPAALIGPVWGMLLRSQFSWKYISYP